MANNALTTWAQADDLLEKWSEVTGECCADCLDNTTDYREELMKRTPEEAEAYMWAEINASRNS